MVVGRRELATTNGLVVPSPALTVIVWNAAGCAYSVPATILLRRPKERCLAVAVDGAQRLCFGLGMLCGIAVLSGERTPHLLSRLLAYTW